VGWRHLPPIARRLRPILATPTFRLALVLAVLAGVRPPAPVVVIGPPQTVHTINPIMGVHTRLTDEVEPWKIQRTLQMVREMGAPWIVEYFPWAYSEPGFKGNFSWEHADLVVDHARAQGLTVIARLGFVPDWARPDPRKQKTTSSYLDEAHYADFGDFVYAFVTHFRGRVGHIIIWNEPNLTSEWGQRPVEPAAYVRLLRIAYARAKQADPNVVVLGGALAPTLEPRGSPFGMNDLDYLEAMYQAGAAEVMDGLAVHTYGFKFPPEAPPDPAVINFRRVELLRAIMERHGDMAKPVYITESGWNDSPRWTRAVRPAQRAAYTVAAYQWAAEHWPWVRVLAMWVFRYPAPQRSYADYFAFVTPEFIPRPVYQVVRAYASGGE
jgi:hypothetical protein